MVLREDKARAFRSAAGALNAVHPADMSRVSARLFVAAGCGAAVLTEFRSSISELFKPGNEVLVFHGFDELVNQASRLLGEVGLTARLGDPSGRRARRDHSFDVQITGILEKLAS